MALQHRLLALGSALLMLSASARADYTITTDAKGGIGQLESLTWTFNGQSQSGLAGTLTTSLSPGGAQFDTYCVDLYHDFYPGTSWSAQLKPILSYAGESGLPAGDNPGGHAGAIGYLYNKFAAGVTNAVQGAALQIAIWKVDYDGNNSFSTGSFQFAPTANNATSIQSEVYSQATAYLTGFNGSQSSSNASYLMADTHPNGLYQDFVGAQGFFGSPNVVPEPSSILLVAAGLGVVGLRKYRNRRRPAIA